MNNVLLNDTEKWLSAMNNENTKRNYRNHINDFCTFLLKFPLEEINKDDIDNANISFNTMLNYKTYMSETKKENGDNYGGQTIRTKIYAVNSWLEYLYKHERGYNVPSPDKLKLDRKTMPKVKGNNGSKPFTYNEVLNMICKAKEYKDGEMKSLLIEFALVTAWRKEAIISSISFGSFYRVKDNVDYWLVDIVDKGDKEDTKAISNDLYERLMKLNPNHEDDDLVFPISNTSVDNLINQLKKDLNIQGDKSFHGIKKASVIRVLDLTDNIFKAQKHACHESIETTAKFYALYNRNFAEDMSLHLMTTLDNNLFDDYTKEELLDLIKNSEDKIKFALIMQANKNKK